MKRRTKIIIGLMAACAATLTLAACNAWDTPYDDIAKEDYTVGVRYDINGGQFASTPEVNIVDVFKLEDVQEGVKLLEPGSDARGENKVYTVPSRSGYFLAGWYATREPRVDANGNALDAEGNLCSESGKEQGYTYSDKWDFENDIFQIEEVTESLKDTKNTSLTLYAAWVPNFTFEIRYNDVDEKGDPVTKSVEYSVDPQIQSVELTLPYWADEQEGVDPEACSGAMTYGSFPTVSGKTFEAVYSDEAMTQRITEPALTHTGSVDYETGTAETRVVYYTSWLEGTYFHIYTAKQLVDNASINACFEIYADLDFTDAGWSNGLAYGDFTGKIEGNGHKLSNITITQNNNDRLRCGVFGRIMSGAVVKDVTFENVILKLNAATRLVGGEFGLFAGSIASGAEIENVSVTGELHIGNVYPGLKYENYQVGLLCANNAEWKSNGKISYQISCVVDVVVSGTTSSYPHKATVNADDTITIEANEDPSRDPNTQIE